ncbi:MAG: hypothetical protein H7144_11510 [Burkholderiales bacterium]|nr:hypothetical protein [Phycisphaerae bacterium]
MMKLTAATLVLMTSFAWGQSAPTAHPAPALRPGSRLVDGYWAKPAAKVKINDLVRLVDDDGRHLLIAQPASWIAPLLRNWRVSVIEIGGSDYAWKLSCPGRVWNDNRSAATQHLRVIAATDDMKSGDSMRLTKIDIVPHQASIQALIDIDDRPTSVNVVLSAQFAELSVAGIGETNAAIIHRADSARQLFARHPGDARRYMLPVLRLIGGGAAVMQPAAADVYRVFPNLPIDPLMTTTITKLTPDLADPDPRTRGRASEELASLGRRGVQAAMTLDLATLAPEAAERIIAFIRDNTREERSVEVLLRDASFLHDCLADPDPAVARAAADAVEKITSARP